MQPRFLPFPAIEKHGIVGDRRTAALVSADGTLDWFCLPDYGDDAVFAALLDPERGGFCRFGPETPAHGGQRYEESTATLLTCWGGDQPELELTDFMPWAAKERPEAVENARVILRKLRAARGGSKARFEMRPRWTFHGAPRVKRYAEGVLFEFDKHTLTLWTSFPVEVDEQGAVASFFLPEGKEAWAMIGMDEKAASWNSERCRTLHAETNAYWREWAGSLRTFPRDNPVLQRCAMTVRLLAHASNNACVAAITMSLPERIGGDRNYDYRYTWVRDASLSIGFLATMGKLEEVSRYLTWLCDLDSCVDAPLQVCYRTDGQLKLNTRKMDGVAGYRGSQPVQVGNGAYKQRQLGSLGWFADAALIFLEQGGEWIPEYGKMLKRVADHVCEAWRQEDSGVWELAVHAQYVASKVMSWVALDRAIRILRRLGEEVPEKWLAESLAIRDQILAKGWSQKKRAFCQRYDSDALDASALLIPLMNFLPPDEPRVLATLDAIERELVIDGLVHRFDPTATLGGDQLPMGEFEGAFLPATFWYAHALAGAGRTEKAAEILRQCEQIAGGPGIYAEEADPRRKSFLGNTPLLFSQVEYARALLALQQAEARIKL